jgi:hypothetical protein
VTITLFDDLISGVGKIIAAWVDVVWSKLRSVLAKTFDLKHHTTSRIYIDSTRSLNLGRNGIVSILPKPADL